MGVDVPLRIVTSWDGNALNRGITNVNTQLGNIQKNFGHLFSGLITAAAVAGVISFGEHIGQISRELSVGQDFAKRYGTDIETIARNLAAGTRGSITFADAVRESNKVLAGLGQLGVDSAGAIGELAQKISSIKGVPISDAIDALVRATTSGRLAQIRQLFPDLAAHLKDFTAANKDLGNVALTTAQRTQILYQMLNAFKDISAPEADPFLKLKVSLTNLMDTFGISALSGKGAATTLVTNLAQTIDDISAKIRSLPAGALQEWVVNIGKIAAAFAGLSVAATIVKDLGVLFGVSLPVAVAVGTSGVSASIGVLIAFLNVAFVEFGSQIRLITSYVIALATTISAYLNVSVEQFTVILGAANGVILDNSLDLIDATAAAYTESGALRTVASSAGTAAGGFDALSVSANTLRGSLILLIPQLIVAAGAYALYKGITRANTLNAEIKEGTAFKQYSKAAGASGEPTFGNPNPAWRWITHEEAVAQGLTNFDFSKLPPEMPKIEIPEIPNIPTGGAVAGKAAADKLTDAEKLVAQRLKDWADSIVTYRQDFMTLAYKYRTGMISEIELRQGITDADKARLDTLLKLKYQIDENGNVIGLSTEHEKELNDLQEKYNIDLRGLDKATRDLKDAQDKMTEQIKAVTDTGKEPFGAPLPKGHYIKDNIEYDAWGNVVKFLTNPMNLSSTSTGGVKPAFESTTFGDWTTTTTSELRRQDGVANAPEKIASVFDKFTTDLRDIVGKFIEAWGWSGGKFTWGKEGKGLAQSVVGAAEPALGKMVGQAFGMSSSMFGPMGSVVGGLIGWGLSGLFNSQKAIKVEQPLDMRLVDINPRLTNMFNWRSVNVFGNRFYGVIESGLY